MKYPFLHQVNVLNIFWKFNKNHKTPNTGSVPNNIQNAVEAFKYTKTMLEVMSTSTHHVTCDARVRANHSKAKTPNYQEIFFSFL